MIESRTYSASHDVQIDGQTSESWSTIIAQFADANIYQTWAYGAVRWGDCNLSHLVLRRAGQIIGAAQARIARVPILPAGVAYLRWAPLCQLRDTAFDPDVLTEMLVRLRHEYVTRRGLALQIIPPGLAEGDRAVAFRSALDRSGLCPEPSLGRYRTVMVDLLPTAEIMRKRLDQKWRNQLNRAEKNGLVLEVSDSRDAYREFLGLYAAMLERKRFETSVDAAEFERIQEHLSGPARMQTFLARSDGQAIAALVCSHTGDTAIYLLGATDERARDLKAAYFLQWQAMLWLKNQGARWYDLGGIDPEANPGGYHFKSGFGGVEAVQLLPHTASGGVLGEVALRGIAWLRRRRSSSRVGVTATP